MTASGQSYPDRRLRAYIDSADEAAVAVEAATRAAADDLLIPLAQKGVASGVAPLDSGSRVSEGNLPANLAATALSATYVATVAAPTGVAATDTAAINAAIASLPAGGTLILRAGEYLTSGGHVISVPMRIQGAGRGALSGGGGTVLRLANASNASMLTLAAQNVTVQDVGLYGNFANQSGTSHGIVASLTSAANYFHLERLWIDGFLGDGIYLQGPSTSLSGTIRGVESRNNQQHGIRIDSSASDVMIANSLTALNQLSGLYINAGDVSCTDLHSWGNGVLNSGSDLSGVYMPSGAGGGCRFVNCYFESNTHGQGATPRGKGNVFDGCHFWKNGGVGLYAFSNTYLTVTGCVFWQNNTNNAAGAGGAGIELDTCTACTVSGNSMYANGGHQKYGYAENANTCTGCVFIGNVSRAADHETGNWLIGAGGTPTIPATPASYNVG